MEKQQEIIPIPGRYYNYLSEEDYFICTNPSLYGAFNILKVLYVNQFSSTYYICEIPTHTMKVSLLAKYMVEIEDQEWAQLLFDLQRENT